MTDELKEIGPLSVHIRGQASGWTCLTFYWRGSAVENCLFETPELARAAAEAKLRELYAALGEVVEP
jgi:hypothetical protein